MRTLDEARPVMCTNECSYLACWEREREQERVDAEIGGPKTPVRPLRVKPKDLTNLVLFQHEFRYTGAAPLSLSGPSEAGYPLYAVQNHRPEAELARGGGAFSATAHSGPEQNQDFFLCP